MSVFELYGLFCEKRRDEADAKAVTQNAKDSVHRVEGMHALQCKTDRFARQDGPQRPKIKATKAAVSASQASVPGRFQVRGNTAFRCACAPCPACCPGSLRCRSRPT